MKYVVILGDGMADYPVPELDGKTPLQVANKPNMDFLARYGVTGLVKTIPESVSPGSDTANLSVLGFDPERYYTGRSPIEAVSMGVRLADDDVAYRCNLVNLSGEPDYADKTMVDYSSDEISSAEAAELIAAVNERIAAKFGGNGSVGSGESGSNNGPPRVKFYPGISYRHCMVWSGGGLSANCTPPHDILERKIGEYLPADDADPETARVLNELMRESYAYLSEHPVNQARVQRGLKPANSIWLWGQGKRLALPSFEDKYGVKGAVISAVDLVRGIGISAGLRSIMVEGATGILETNYEGKANAAIDALNDGCGFAYIHVEAPDECGHRHEVENKVKSIELIDQRLIPIILDGLEKTGEDYRILCLPDHPTPLTLRTHTRDAVPFALYTKSAKKENPLVKGYDETEAKKTGVYVEPGYTLMDRLLGRNFVVQPRR